MPRRRALRGEELPHRVRQQAEVDERPDGEGTGAGRHERRVGRERTARGILHPLAPGGARPDERADHRQHGAHRHRELPGEVVAGRWPGRRRGSRHVRSCRLFVHSDCPTSSSRMRRRSSISDPTRIQWPDVGGAIDERRREGRRLGGHRLGLGLGDPHGEPHVVRDPAQLLGDRAHGRLVVQGLVVVVGERARHADQLRDDRAQQVEELPQRAELLAVGRAPRVERQRLLAGGDGGVRGIPHRAQQPGLDHERLELRPASARPRAPRRAGRRMPRARRRAVRPPRARGPPRPAARRARSR